MPLKLMYITNATEVALIAERAGVDRVFVDLETLGKQERQGHVDSVKSKHSVEDIRAIHRVLTEAELLVRIDPIHEGSAKQIDAVIEAGADIIMLPMWKCVDDVARFLSCVKGRCRTMLLLETKEAEQCLDDVLQLPGIDEVHIGLNDLHLSYGRTFMFEMLADGTVERICKKLKNAGIFYGFGGIGRIGEGMLPAEHILGEHIRLGSGMVILSRSFCDVSKTENLDDVTAAFAAGIPVLRQKEKLFRCASADSLEENRRVLCGEVAKIVEKIKGARA